VDLHLNRQLQALLQLWVKQRLLGKEGATATAEIAADSTAQVACCRNRGTCRNYLSVQQQATAATAVACTQ